MLKHAYMLSFVALATCVPLAAFETKKYNPPRLQELAANVCVREAAKDKSFYEKLKQTALTTAGLVPFKSTKLFSKTSITNPLSVGTYEIVASPEFTKLLTRDTNNSIALHSYKEAIIENKENNINVHGWPCPPYSSFKLALYRFAYPNYSLFPAPNGRKLIFYDNELAKVHKECYRDGDSTTEMQLPKCDFYAISNDGSLFVGCTQSQQEKECTLHIINLTNIAKHFYPTSQATETITSENISTAIKLPINAGTLSISPDNQHVALLPAWSMIPSDKSREPECVYVHTVKDLLAHKADMPQAKEFFCPKGKKPSCITWMEEDRIALASEKGDITLHNHETNKELFKMRSHNHRVTALAYDPVKNFLFAGYEATKKGQMLELINLNNAQPLSAEYHAITAILHRACKNEVWADHFDTEHKKLPAHAQQLINSTMTPAMENALIWQQISRRCWQQVEETLRDEVRGRRDINRSASKVCAIS